MTSPAPFSEEAYLAELEAASNSDLSLVEGRGVVTVYTAADDTDELLQDGDGNFVVTIVPGNVPSDEDAWDKSFQLFLRETTEVSLRSAPPPRVFVCLHILTSLQHWLVDSWSSPAIA